MVRLKILILGGGIGGLNAALNCAIRGHEVAVFERTSAFEDIGTGLQLGSNAMHVNHFTGIVPVLYKNAVLPEKFSLRHHRTGQPYWQAPVRGVFEKKYGAGYISIHRADLLSALVDACQAHGVKLHLNSTGTKAEMIDNAKQVRLAVQQKNKEKIFDGDLLIGADGLHSLIKATIFDDTALEDSGYTAWRGLVDSDKLPSGLIENHANVWIGPNKHFVAYYLRDQKLVNFVAAQVTPPKKSKDDMETLRRAFTNWNAPVRAVLNACQNCHATKLFDAPAPPIWHKGRMVLLGDACHPMLPFMAQAAAMALEDGYVLAEEISTDKPLEDALCAYTKRRQARVALMRNIAIANGRLFRECRPWMLAARWFYFKLGKISNLFLQHRLNRVYGVNVTAQGKK